LPRIRNIKPEFWTDEKLVELGPWERLLFIGLWNFADDDGFLAYSPKRIKMQIFPADDVDLVALLEVLTEHSLITHYMCSDRSGSTHVIRVTNWAKHQKPNRPTPSKYLDMDLQEFRPEPRNHAGYTHPARSNSVSTHGPLTEDSVPERERGGEMEGEVVLAFRTNASPSARESKILAHRIVNAWTEAAEKKPPARVVLDATAQIQAMVNEGIDPDDISRGIAEWWSGKYPASTIPNYVARAQQGPKIPAATGTQRAMVGMELVRQLEEEESTDEPF
jgi:hypothetical protein